MSTLRGIVRVILSIGWILFCIPFVTLAWALRMDALRGRLAQFFQVVTAMIFGLRISVRGNIDPARPLMLISNHTTYLDVFVLGKLVPLSFMPKKEVRSWPVIGFFCVLSDCIFVERRPSEMTAATEEVRKRLANGKVVCLFPEGTTSDGYTMKPFKSGFLSLAETLQLPVQPASIVYTHIGREPMSPARSEEVAWVGDATFFGHFWHVLTLPYLRIQVELLPARDIAAYGNRKALTQACEVEIKQHVAAIHARVG